MKRYLLTAATVMTQGLIVTFLLSHYLDTRAVGTNVGTWLNAVICLESFCSLLVTIGFSCAALSEAEYPTGGRK